MRPTWPGEAVTAVRVRGEHGHRAGRTIKALDARRRRLNDVEFEAVDDEPFARVGDAAGPLRDQTADGGRPAAGRSRRTALQYRRAGSFPSVSTRPPAEIQVPRRHLLVVLVEDFTDELLEQIFERRPSVPPNSSITTARWRRSRCVSSRGRPWLRLAGVTPTGRAGRGSPGASLKIECVQHPRRSRRASRETRESGCSHSGRRPPGSHRAAPALPTRRWRCAAS